VNEHSLALSDGTLLSGKKIVICAGGHARRITFPGSEYALTHHDIWSLHTLPRSIAIVGGAATGCQLASILAAFGVEVWLLESAPRILAAEDELVSRTMGEIFERRGIHIIRGIGGVDHIEKTPDGLRLWYKQQEQSLPLDVEAVVMAVGWVGNVEQLNLSAAGLQATERGYVAVDDCLRTSVPHIFAAGDITGRMMLVQSGSYEGRLAVENALLAPDSGGQPYQHQIVPHGGFTDPEYGSVGLTEEKARSQYDCAVAVAPFLDVDRAVIDGYTEGFCKLIVSKDTHRILGAHVVGEQAVEIIQLVAAGMAADMWVEQLAELELAYPTYTAIVGLAARKIVRELGVVPLAAAWRTLGQVPSAEWEHSSL
jgi:dihydrolipoamide dehydrogenase